MGIRQLLAHVRHVLRVQVELAGDPAQDLIAAPTLAEAVAGTPLEMAFERFALTATERYVIALMIAQELCPITRQMIRAVATESVTEPTIDAIRRIVYAELDQRSWHELDDAGALRRWLLIERADPAAIAPDYRQTFKVARRVLALAHGDARLDPEVGRFASIHEAPALDTLIVDAASVARIRSAFEAKPGLIVVSGRAGTGRRSLLAAIARSRGLQILAIDGHRLAKQRDVARLQLRAIARECRLLDLVPLIQNLEALGGPEDTDRFDLVEDELSGVVLATATLALARRWKRAPTLVELPPPTSADLAALWSRALPAAGSGDADVLATLYPLAPTLIRAVGEAAMHEAAGAPMKPAHVEAGLRSVLDDRLAGLATRVTVTQSWDDLILPDDQAVAVTELLARIRKRRTVYETWGFANKVGKGLGVAALFSGPPGTGKTMCAGLIARELGTELYQVDVSKLSSKWIGETEKNLASLFDAAEAGHAILLFDEADSVFGRRTEVRSSNDRHANQETGFLLQRLESFAGIVILTTNHESAIDEAFRRRLAVHVRLPVPDIDERKRLWRVLIPKAAPVAPRLELDKLADKFAMTGGHIRNAVLRAAFLAADEDAPISSTHLTRAAHLEYEAMGKLAS